MLYFAYGSNMDLGQMKTRCPSVSFVGVARLADHRLAFTRRSVKRNCGVADAVREHGHSVWGAVFRLSEVDVRSLDTSEGYQPGRPKNSYWRRECPVFLDGDEDRPLTAQTYFADPQSAPPLPSQAYKDAILSGARRWNLPADYIAELEGIEVCE